MTDIAERLRAALENLPRRKEKLGGQTFSYIKLEDAVAAIIAALEAVNEGDDHD